MKKNNKKTKKTKDITTNRWQT